MKISLFSAYCFVFLLTGIAFAQTAQSQPEKTIHLVEPAEGATVLGRHPEIRAVFSGPPPAELLVILDGTDITPLLDRTTTGFSFIPPRALPSGSHLLNITTRDAAGIESQESASFTSRHGTTVVESSSQNLISYSSDLAIATHQYPQELPKQKLEGILQTESQFKTDNWYMSFKGGVRQLEQNTAPLSPVSRGIDATSWLLTLGFNHEITSAVARFGDIQINETRYTVANLSRRGGDINVSYDRLNVHLFNVAGQQFFGFQGGTGLGSNMDRYVSGVAAGLKLLDNRLQIKGVLADGGEDGSSYTIATAGYGKKGSVAGGQINTDFFQGKLRSEMEYARSRYDPNTSDTQNSSNDKAWRVKLGGTADILTYDGEYEYIGTEFTSIGNLAGNPKDREGAALRSGMLLGSHSISANLSRYADNVSGDSTRPRIVNYQGAIDYSYGGWTNVPLGVAIQTNLQKSEKEPSETSKLDLRTDSLSGRIGLLTGNFRIQAVATGSWQNDNNSNDNDGKIATYQLTPTYGHDATQVSSSIQLMQTWRNNTDRSDLVTTSIDLRSAWFERRLSGELSGTASLVTKGNSRRFMTLYSRMSYGLPEYRGGIKSSLALRGSYNHSYDQAAGAVKRDEIAVFLVLSATVPLLW